MLSENDKDYVIEVLTSRLILEEKPRTALVLSFMNTTFAEDLVQGKAREIAMDAVRLCINDGWGHMPTWMERLLKIYELTIVDAKIAEIWERSRHQPPPVADPLDQTVLNNSTPFVNRRLLRSHLQRLSTAGANLQPILVVNGDTQCGKSYSTNYIEHFSNVKSILTYRLSLDPELGLSMGPREVAMDLVYQMGRPLTSMPAPETNLNLYARQLAGWVLNEASQTSSQHWFVLDNFRGEMLLPATRNFLVALSDRITTGVFSHRCRLILIGFDRAVLTVDPGKVEEERIQPCTANDVEFAVDEILKRAAGHSFNMQHLVAYVCTDLPKAPEKMYELNQRLRMLLRAVNELTVIFAAVPDIDFEAVLLQVLTGLPKDRAERMNELQQRLDDLKDSLNEI
ncbi:hypothetical protein [Chitinophaga sp. GbtcB8]|uniref:hypothetical protein n=1 Tax=Chitinophaga sp. GbtcB8 TaxID=2824753 RepID=UPI001C30693B|nr:hypothetical protein [Chitinophaga sp. GbtcB8]